MACSAEFTHWRSEQFYNIDFAGYSFLHHDFPRHFHDHYVIELVVNGADQFYCGTNKYVAIGNELVFINPGEVHTGGTVADTALCYYSMTPDEKTLQQIAAVLERSLDKDFSFPQTLVSMPKLAKKMYLLFDMFHSSSANGLRHEELFFDCMNELLITMCDKNDASVSHDKKDPRIRVLIDFICAQFKEPLSLKQMANLVRLNPFHLIRLFKAGTGISPYEYMLIRRIEYAKKLLQKGNNVQEAALESGFYDTSHFNRSFSKLVGTTPKNFRSSKCQYRTIFTA